MKKVMLTSTLLMMTACGQAQPRQATWASGANGAESTEAIETVTFRKGGEPEVSEIPRDATDASDDDGITQLMKGVDVLYFSINRTPVRLAHGSAVTWDGCSKPALIKGGYGSDKSCGKAYFHQKFEGQMNKQFFLCVERGANKANLAQPQRVFVNHDGSYNNRKARNSKRLSMHAYARALDIAAFNLVDAAGKVTKISTNVRNFRGTTKVFYNEFRQCWKEAMPKSCRNGMTEAKGSIGIPSSALGGNKLHNDHIHLSYAPCAG